MRTTLCLFLLLLVSDHLFAQLVDRHLSRPPMRIGLLGGYGVATQSGTLPYGSRRFSAGSGQAGSAMLTFDLPLAPLSQPTLRLELAAGWLGMSIDGGYNERRAMEIAMSNDTHYVNVDFNKSVVTDLHYLSVTPMLSFGFLEYLHAGVGCGAIVPLSGVTRGTETILTKSVQIEEVGVTEVYYPNSPDKYTRELRTLEREDLRTALTVNACVGATLAIGPWLNVVARVAAIVPMTSMLDGEKLRINAFQGMLGLSIDL